MNLHSTLGRRAVYVAGWFWVWQGRPVQIPDRPMSQTRQARPGPPTVRFVFGSAWHFICRSQVYTDNVEKCGSADIISITLFYVFYNALSSISSYFSTTGKNSNGYIAIHSVVARFNERSNDIRRNRPAPEIDDNGR